MVTANVFNRFKYKTTMNDSYVEKYIRAKRRNEVTPKCLFGAPSESESEQFLSEQSGSEQTDENQRVLEKYDLTDVPTEVLAEFRRTKPDAPEENVIPSTSSDTTERVKFQPRIITEGNPPPRENLFSPIDKIESTSPNRTKQAKITGKPFTRKFLSHISHPPPSPPSVRV